MSIQSFNHFAFFVVIVCSLFAWGCQTQSAESSVSVVDQPAPMIGSTGLRPTKGVAGYSVEGKPIDYYILGNGRDRVMIIAGIHGSEPAGVPLTHRLMNELAQQPQRIRNKTIIFVPDANPDGTAIGTRGNVNGVDLNRNFPAANFRNRDRFGTQPLSQPESQALYDLLHRFMPHRMTSLHQPLDCLDYDGEGAKEYAEYLGQYTDLPVKKLGSRPGSLGSYAGLDLGIPIVTVEFRRDEHLMSDEDLWARYGDLMLAMVDYSGR